VRNWFRFSLVLTIWLPLSGLHAQSASTPLSFEVVSVKTSAPDIQGIFLQPQPGGGLRATGATLNNLIALAYGVREFEISGGPRWAGLDRFDIDARAGSPPAAAESRRNGGELQERVRSLLAERFRLAAHSEAKEQDVYALVVAKNGPKFHEATPESGASIRGQRGSIKGQGTTMQLLALNLSSQMGHRVTDQTGLAGKYDFALEWTPDVAVSASGVDAPLASTPGESSVLAALEEQLGLRLEPQKRPVKVIVIDHVEKPSGN
jgi:uncharacterized protein (TIGR03435 family)